MGSRVAVFGDVQVELVTSLGGRSFADIDHDHLLYQPIHRVLGGGAVNFALAARDRFDTVTLVGSVGADPLGDEARRLLERDGVETRLARCEGVATGTSFYVREGRPGAPDDVRLMIIDADSANYRLDGDFVAELDDWLARQSLVLLDGYCLLREPRRSACERVLRTCTAAGVPVAFDLVPHHAHRFFSFDEIVEVVGETEILISEVRTLRWIMGLDVDEAAIDEDVARDTARALEERAGPRTLFLRYGFGNIEDSLIIAPGAEPLLETTGYRDDDDPRGFGDRLSARQLGRWLAARA